MKTFTKTTVISVMLLIFAETTAHAQIDPRYDGLWINEVYFDPPGSDGDELHEYIELRGTPGMSLDNHYLIFIENESNPTTGQIEMIFDMNGRSMGTNGYLTFRQREEFDPNQAYPVAPGTTDLRNDRIGTSEGYGSGAGSTIGASDEGGEGITENSGFTVFVIRDNSGASAPTLGQILDNGTDGLDIPNGTADWTILDGIGVHSEAGESAGRLYAQVNFGPEATTNIESGATYDGLGYEIEYAGRWANSSSQTVDDWHISNLTVETVSGFSNNADFRQSGDPHPETLGGPLPPDFMLESNKSVPYGTNLTNSLGRPNYPIPDGDLNQDGFVGQSDLSIVLDGWGQTDLSLLGYWLSGDPSGDGLVGQSDLSFVLGNWGAGELFPLQTPAPSFGNFNTAGVDLSALESSPWAHSVPEPASVALWLSAVFGISCYRNKR